MRLVDDDHIEVRRCKQPVPILPATVIDGVEHRRIGREHDARILVILVRAEIAQRHVREVLLKGVFRLLDECGTICEEENIGHIPATAEDINQRSRRSGLSGTGRHDQQILAEALLHMIADRTNRLFLVVTVRNLIIDGDFIQLLMIRTPIDQSLQIILAENAVHLSLRTALIIPEVGVEAVRREHDRPATVLPLQTVCVEGALLAANVGVFTRALRLHDGQRQLILAHQDIIAESTLTDLSHHIIDRKLLEDILIDAGQLPAHQLQIKVDVLLTRTELRDILRLEAPLLLMLLLFARVLLGHLRDLFTELFDLRVLFIQETLLLLDLFRIDDDLLCRDLRLIEAALLIVLAVAVVDPLDEFEKTMKGGHGITRRDTLFGVDREIPQLDHVWKLAPGVGIHRKAKGRLMDQGLQIVLIRHHHGKVRRIHPLDRQLQRLSCTDGTHRRRGGEHLLRFDRRRCEECIFLFILEKFKIGHLPFLRCKPLTGPALITPSARRAPAESLLPAHRSYRG